MEATQRTQRTRRMYTQGINMWCKHTGDFEVSDRGMLTIKQVMAIVRALPVPAMCDSTQHICPPCIGFSEAGVCGNVCRVESGKYFILPGGQQGAMQSQEASLADVEAWVKSKFEEKAKV